jgi:hypothetical protein
MPEWEKAGGDARGAGMSYINMKTFIALGLLVANSACAVAAPITADWRNSASLWILTTTNGASIPAGSTVDGFPLLVRLDNGSFRFDEARPDGADLRFTLPDGTALPHQLEEWNSTGRIASVWVRIPKIEGNAQQEIRMHWGNAGAAAVAGGPAVFDATNGYLGVWHMGGPRDEVSSGMARDSGTTATRGIVGPARRLAGDQGLFIGDKLTGFPTGSEPHSTEAWIRPLKPNATVIGWGNEQAQGKVVMQFRSPPHVGIDAYFSDSSIQGKTTVPTGQWTHVLHTYELGMARLYVNGVLDVESTRRSSPLNVRTPARLWIGGWYDHYTFEGDLDEVRVSKGVRSPEWARLQFENQKPLQTLVGHPVTAGDRFTVSQEALTVPEGRSARVTAEAGGARKVSWILKRDGRETVVAVDRFDFTVEAGRFTGDGKATLQFKAVYADTIKTRDIAITLREAIADPQFTLKAPRHWDGRKPIEIVPQISNLDRLKATGATNLQTVWKVGDLATTREIVPGKLLLTRAQNSGTLTVTVTLDNGGSPVTQSCTIAVSEPRKDRWAERIPDDDDLPEDNQFYARDDRGEGTLFCKGTLTSPADAVFVRVLANGKPWRDAQARPEKNGMFRLSVRLKPGLVRYDVEFGSRSAGKETLLRRATNVVCGDAYLLQGQSNTVASDWGKEEPEFRSPWIRTFGSPSGDPNGLRLWGEAVHRNHDGEKLQIGYWGMELARRLVEEHSIPICILNGAVGGTRIDQHQRNPAQPNDRSTIYGRLLWRAQQARLTHGIRGVIWHQGENDQGADGPTGGFGWETYREYFIDLAAAWKRDYPNVQHYHVFQIWPLSCSMGVNGSDNRLREVQRNLPTAFSHLSVLSTLGVEPPGGCHFPAAGYAEFARMLFPLIERDHYGKTFPGPIEPPNLRRASFARADRTELSLEFDQPVLWTNTLAGEILIDGVRGKVLGGAGSGNLLTLKLAGPSEGRTITYLDSSKWSQARLLKGTNGLAALTFCEVPIGKP